MSIAVFLESYNGKMVKAAAETIGAAKFLAEKTGKPIYGVAMDKETDAIVAEAGKLGISTVKASSGIDLYHPPMYARLISNAVSDADIILFPATVWGKEVAPMVAVKLDAVPVSDIIGIEGPDTYTLALQGNKIQSKTKVTGKVVVTVRAGVFDIPATSDGTANVESIAAETVAEDEFMKLAEVLVASSDRPELTEADIIVSGGRGTGSPEDFAKHIEPLADAMGAAVGASRAVVDAGWRPHEEQVGQTGKFVSPKVYVAVGISGAIQHLAGMSSSEIIVAVNKDPEAPIFKIADYGVVGDLFEVVPKLTEAIKVARTA